MDIHLFVRRLPVISNAFKVFCFIGLFFFFSCKVATRKKHGDITTNGNTQIASTNVIRPDTILLVSMDFNEVFLIPPIKNKIKTFYKLPVKHIQSSLPRFAYYKERDRYRADSLLNYLAALNNRRDRFITGLTSKDISTTNGSILDWGIFGLGSLSAKGCITSSFRLKRNASTALLTERIQKVVLHEVGHNFGLPHCTSIFPCFMKAADGKISEVDTEPMEMCSVCRGKIRLN